jgi:4-carboxymuconolactone decarboxylase
MKERITMGSTTTDPNKTLQMLGEGDMSVVDTLMRMTGVSVEESGLDPKTFMLVRIAALTTLDAPPASWLVNLGGAGGAGITPGQVVGTLIAIAPAIGTVRIVSAAGNIVRALGLATAIAEDTGNGSGTKEPL